MKTISKILSVVLVLSMILGFALIGRAAETALATFTFPASSNTSAWQDGNDIGSNNSFTHNSYTLTFTDCSKIYSKGNDGAGRGFIKFGTSSVVGTLTFTVPDEVTRVELQLAGYKAKTSKYTINGGSTVTLTKQASQTSAASEYDVVSVDTSSNKTVIVASVSGCTRMVLFSVIYYGDSSTPVCEHTYDDCVDTTCNKNCGYSRTAPGHVYANCEATACSNCTNGNRSAVAHEYTNEYDASCNNCTAGSRTVTLPAANSTLDFVTANKIGAAQDHNKYTENKYVVEGTIKKIDSTTYGNITLEDDNGNTFYLYTVKDVQGNNFGYMAEIPAVGDKIKVLGPIGRYNSSVQMNPAVIQVEVANCQHEYTNEYDAECNTCGDPRTVSLPAADSTLTLDVANKLGVAQMHSTYTTNKYYVEGTITEITSDQYGNMTIKDAAGKTFVIYGSYDGTGDKGFKDMANAPKVGDKVKVYGVVGQYSGTAQMKNGWIVAINGTSTIVSNNNPKDGDPVMLIPTIIMMVLSGTGVALVGKKKSF